MFATRRGAAVALGVGAVAPGVAAALALGSSALFLSVRRRAHRG
ncbi:hypothetical protein AB0N16_15935 [Streptomyces sp. NPDC051105]